MRKLLVAVIVVFVLSFGCFAVSLDDPIQPKVPTIGSEIKNGYEYAQSLASATPYNQLAFQTYDREYPNLSNKTDAYMAGFWLGAWECNVLATKKSRFGKWLEWKTHNKMFSARFSDCCKAIEITENQVATLLGVDLSYLSNNSR